MHGSSWAHWKAITITTLAGLLLALAVVIVIPKVYSADASGILQASQAASSGSPVVGDQLAQNPAKTYVTTAESRTVAQYVKDRLGLHDSLEELVSRVTVTNPTNSTVIKVTAKASTPTGARDLAETWLDGIGADIQNLQNAATGSVDVKLYPNESAVLPSSPSSPNVKLYLALGLLVGAAIGVGYALVRARFDRRIRSAETIEKDFELALATGSNRCTRSRETSSSPQHPSSRTMPDAHQTTPSTTAFGTLRIAHELRAQRCTTSDAGTSRRMRSHASMGCRIHRGQMDPRPQLNRTAREQQWIRTPRPWSSSNSRTTSPATAGACTPRCPT